MRATPKPGRTTSTTCKRLLQKFDTARSLVPQPVLRRASRKTRLGAIYFGSTSPAMDEALDLLAVGGIPLDAMRLRAFPFPTRWPSSSMRTRRCSWWSRTATARCARC
jgi:hypothetical protein